MRAARGWERVEQKADAEALPPAGPDGHEDAHPLLRERVRDIASGGEGLLTAVTHELHGDGRLLRIAHIRSPAGTEWTASADNIQPAR
ncbi:hypothetical protein [Streptomyces sp. NPDC090025]|uniref:hypothetical protein n=1 Tax=Streptomyces sp. NPDC090025 TaxID=3365922 RepID=UPI003837DA8A